MAFVGWASDTTTGGAGGSVIKVTTLNFSGAGSFKEAIETAGSRIIEFDIEGTIDGGGVIQYVSNDDVTIDCETAPGNGVSFTKMMLVVSNDNTIITHFRTRVGTNGQTSGWSPDGLSTDAATNFIFDHCSIAWSIDEALSISGPTFSGATPTDWENNTSHTGTVSNCIMSEPLNDSIHSSGIHGFGTLMFVHITEILFINNIWVSCQSRSPLVTGGSKIALVNNVIYNSAEPFIKCEATTTRWSGHTAVQSYINIVGNVAVIGPDANISPLYFNHNVGYAGAHYNLHWDDNIAKDTPFEAGRTIKDSTGNLVQSGTILNEAWHSSIVPMDSSLVFDYIISNVGAYPTNRDDIDNRILAGVQAGTHSIIDNENDVGGYSSVHQFTAGTPTQSGKFGYTEAEKNVWVGRAANGPYEIDNETPAYVPWGGDWDRIINGHPLETLQRGATYFKDNWNDAGLTPTWDGSTAHATIRNFGAQDEPEASIARGIKNAAFYYHLYADTDYSTAVVGFLLRQEAVSAADFSNDSPLFNDTPYFKTAKWKIMLVTSWDMVRDTASPTDKATIDAYFSRHAHWFKDSVHAAIAKNFPNRLSDDYATRLLNASDGAKNTGEYAYQDGTGTRFNQIYTIHKWFNNRRADAMGLVGHVGVLLDDQTLIDHAKRYFHEWMKFSVFTDGSYGEFERNGDYAFWFEGCTYGSIILQHYTALADILARNGDFSLYDYTTSDGIYGTDGGPKNLELVIDTFLKIENGDYIWYYANDWKFGGTVPVQAQYRLDLVDGNDGDRQVLHSIYFAPRANMYFQKTWWKDVYTHQDAGTIAYTGKYFTAGRVNYPFGGTAWMYPGMMIMFGETESLDIYNYTPIPPPTSVFKYRKNTKGKGSHYLNSKAIFS